MTEALALHSPKDGTKYSYVCEEICYRKNEEQSGTGMEGAHRKRSRSQAHHQQPQARSDGSYILTTCTSQQCKLASVFMTTRKISRKPSSESF